MSQQQLEITSGTATIEDYQAALEAAILEISQLKASKPAKASKSKRPYVFTPFQAAKVMNEERAALQLNPVTPQMLYSYARKGKFVITLSDDGRKSVDTESFYSWMRIHNAKNA
jgi:hypothetical protein